MARYAGSSESRAYSCVEWRLGKGPLWDLVRGDPRLLRRALFSSIISDTWREGHGDAAFQGLLMLQGGTQIRRHQGHYRCHRRLPYLLGEVLHGVEAPLEHHAAVLAVFSLVLATEPPLLLGIVRVALDRLLEVPGRYDKPQAGTEDLLQGKMEHVERWERYLYGIRGRGSWWLVAYLILSFA